jgi:hypothetical protein
MKFMMKGAVLLIPLLALATPAFALNPPGLADPSQPGSVIVYPKFINMPQVTVDGNTVSRTEIEIGAVCPDGFTPATLALCTEHTPVKVQFHWVCPGTEGLNSNICPEESFQVVLSVFGKLAFTADGIPINGNTPRVPAAPCPRGYLIGWVINTADVPIKFDGLIGNAVIRGPNLAAGTAGGSSTAVSAYSAITIQADPAVGATTATGGQGAVLPGTANGAVLPFTGVGSGGYTQITGVATGDVRFDKTAAGLPGPNVLSTTSITMLTLDVFSGLPNNPTMVPITFYNESDVTPSGTNPAFEFPVDTQTEFVCWNQVQLASLAGGNLTQAFMGTRKGVFVAGPARNVPDGNAPDGFTGPATLIALVETQEGTVANGMLERKYNFNTTNNGVPVPTTFVPFP